jgi:hypothetical protein
MAKNDYDVIVFKILLYFYGCLKHEIKFEQATFEKTIGLNEISEEYFTQILRMMKNDNLIEGTAFQKAWGGEYILISNISDIIITSDGIHYLKENSTMQIVKDHIVEGIDLVAKLVEIVKL